MLPAHILALATALICFPAAVGYGSFGDEVTVTPQGTALGLNDSAAAFDQLGRTVRAGTLLAALVTATLPTRIGAGWSGLLVVASGWLVVVLILRRLSGRLPRLPLPALLRLGMIAGVPLAAAATLALALGS
ncbi:MAG: hypothetical protein HC822_21580 [Oscillochloris sp.]|nr:hypothetical protein [Oscillochloris sp.]